MCDEKRDYDGAIAQFREAIRLTPGDANVHSNLGVALMHQGKVDEAIAAHRQAIRLSPDNSAVHTSIGLALKNQGKLSEAIASFREAVRLAPDSGPAHSNLGLILASEGKLAEAIAECKEAIRLEPGLDSAHSNLGAILCDRIGDYEGAAAEFREAIRLKSDSATAHYNLGNALQKQEKFAEAIIAFREAVRLQPDNAEAHCNLGQRLRAQALYADALTEFRRGHDLGSKQPGWRYPSEQWIRECEQMVALAGKLPAILKGDAEPGSATERVAIASICYDKQLHAAAARFLSDAFQIDGKLADDLQAGERYNAACSAALAGCGQARDDPPPNEAARTKLRQKALSWLKADLALWTKRVESGSPQAKASAIQTLQHWKTDSDLAGIRDPEALKRLPESEQKSLRALWSEVDGTLKRAST